MHTGFGLNARTGYGPNSRVVEGRAAVLGN
jgi:hypothetical protein